MITKTETKTTKDEEERLSSILRPRSAYNFFCKYQRDIILHERLQETGKADKTLIDHKIGENLIKASVKRKYRGVIDLKSMSKVVSQRWKDASTDTKNKFKVLAEKDKVRYVHELKGDVYMDVKKIDSNTASCSAIDGSNPYQYDVERANETIQASAQIFSLGRTHVPAIPDIIQTPNTSIELNDIVHIDHLGITWTKNELDFLKCFSKR